MKNTVRLFIEWFVLFTIVIRPSLDVFTDLNIPFGPLSLNPAAILSLLLLAGGIMWFVILSPAERKWLLHLPIFQFTLIWMIVISPWGFVPLWLKGSSHLECLREWIRLLSYLPLIAVVAHFVSKGNFQRIIWGLLLSLIVPVMVGLYQILFHEGALVRGVHRIQGTFVHPNPFSFYLVVMVGITLWCWRWKDHRILFGVVLAFEMLLLLFTFSFTGIAMLGTLILCLAVFESQKVRRMVLALGVLFIIVFLITPTGRYRLWEELEIENLDEIERTGRITNSVTWRLLNWRFLYREWVESPWIGYGLDRAAAVNQMKRPSGVGHDPHNDYVRFMVETGVIGTFTVLAWLTSIGVALWRSLKQAKVARYRNFILTALGLYFAWLVGSMNDNLITATAYQYCLWAVLAAAAGLSQIVTSKDAVYE